MPASQNFPEVRGRLKVAGSALPPAFLSVTLPPPDGGAAPARPRPGLSGTVWVGIAIAVVSLIGAINNRDAPRATSPDDTASCEAAYDTHRRTAGLYDDEILAPRSTFIASCDPSTLGALP